MKKNYSSNQIIIPHDEFFRQITSPCNLKNVLAGLKIFSVKSQHHRVWQIFWTIWFLNERFCYQITSSCRLTEFFFDNPSRRRRILHQFDYFFRTSLKDVLYLFWHKDKTDWICKLFKKWDDYLTKSWEDFCCSSASNSLACWISVKSNFVLAETVTSWLAPIWLTLNTRK